MGIQTMSSQGGGQQLLSQALVHKSSWYNFTLSELENQLRDLGKPLGSMNFDELINIIWMAEASQPTGMNVESQRQASITVARAFSGKTVDEVWRDIQQGKKKSFGKEIKCQSDLPLGEMTLEDFLVEAGIFAETSFSSSVRLNMVDGLSPQDFSQEMDISPTPSMGTLSDTSTSGRKRDVSDALERTAERRLRRKIKNRESAARSRARKQAYHNELVSKVSCLEEENTRLKKEKELETMLPGELSSEPKYQLRRTSSASF